MKTWNCNSDKSCSASLDSRNCWLWLSDHVSCQLTVNMLDTSCVVMRQWESSGHETMWSESSGHMRAGQTGNIDDWCVNNKDIVCDNSLLGSFHYLADKPQSVISVIINHAVICWGVGVPHYHSVWAFENCCVSVSAASFFSTASGCVYPWTWWCHR